MPVIQYLTAKLDKLNIEKKGVYKAIKLRNKFISIYNVLPVGFAIPHGAMDLNIYFKTEELCTDVREFIE